MRLTAFVSCLVLVSSALVVACSSFASDLELKMRTCKITEQENTTHSQYPAQIPVTLKRRADNQSNCVYLLSVTVQAPDPGSKNQIQMASKQQTRSVGFISEDIENKQHFPMTNTITAGILAIGFLCILWWCGFQLRIANRFGRSMAFSSIRSARALSLIHI